jgi:hypothetical protein
LIQKEKNMKRPIVHILMLIAAAMLTACGTPAGNSPANGANGANTAAKPAAAAPTKDSVVALEKAAWKAWETRDTKYFEENISDKYVGFGASGRMDKAASIKALGDTKCEVKSYSFSDENLHMAGPDVAFLTFKAAQDYTCDGKKGPGNVWSASIYVREGDKWKNAFYAEAPVVDPKAAPAKPAEPAKKDEASAKPAEAKPDEAKPDAPKPDAATDALFAVEKKAWEDWMKKDAKGLDAFAAKDMVSLSGAEGWTDRAASLKRWSDPTCDIKAVSVTDPASVAFGSDYALLTFKATVDGKCGGQSIPPEWGATIYGKEGGVWKALMTMGTAVM